MDYGKTAAAILAAVGGAKNVSHLENCSTRLRFTLVDTGKADVEGLKRIPGVLGVAGQQPQVVIGNEVIEVKDALMKLPGMGNPSAQKPASREKVKVGAVVLDFIVGVFQPLIPAIAGAGVLKALMLLLTLVGVSKTAPTVTTLIAISDATFYFLPLLVAVTTATKLNSNRLVAMAAVSVMLLPSLSTAIGKGTSVFGITIPNITYSALVFPAVLCVLLLATLEKALTKVTPKPIRIFFVPMVCLLITVPATLLLLGPIGFWMGTYFTQAVLWVYKTLGWVAFPLLAAALPFIISVGMHKAFIPYVVNQLSTAKYEPLYNPASLAHNIAEAGSSFGVALRTKDSEMRSTAMSAGLSALFGITEPALYGVTIQNKRALGSVIAGAVCGASYLGLTHVISFVAVGPGVASMPMFIDTNNPMNIVNAIIGAAIAFVVAMVASLLLWSDAASATLKARGVAPMVDVAPGEVLAPVDGEVIALSDVEDKVFSGGVLGQGCAIKPADGEFRSPAKGVVTMFFDTKHAFGLTTDEGVELLIHVGLDTVRLGGKHFTSHVAKGDSVEAGQLLLSVDLAAVAAAGFDTTTPVVVTNHNKVDVSELEVGRLVKHGEPLFHTSAKVMQDA